MFIQDLRIDRFGSVANLAIDNLTQDITVIQGGPGTGKTTLLQFARAILFGFDESTRSRYLPSISSKEFGGSITWARGHRHYTVRRHDDGKFNGHFEVLDDGHPASRVALTESLQGVSADLYSRLFAVDFSRRPDVTGLLDEADRCGFNIEGRAIDTVKLQELNRRLATLQATCATLGSVGQSAEALQSRRRELLDDIAELQVDTSRRHEERSQTQSQIEVIQRQLDAYRQELHAHRKAIDEMAAARQDCRSLLAKAEASAANCRTHETEIRALDAQIERWQGVLREAAIRYEARGKHGPVTKSTHPRFDDFEANLVALDTYLGELELAATPDTAGGPTWTNADYAAKMQALRERLILIRNQLARPMQTTAAANCDCERKQLTRTQAELQVSLRYLEEERDALGADNRPSQELTNEIIRLKHQLEQLDAKETELQQRFDSVTLMMRPREIDLAALQQRLHALATDLTERLARRQEELQRIEDLLNEIERRHTLLESITEIQRQIRHVEDGEGESPILRSATSYLRRISASEFQRLEVTQGKHVWVADAKGHRLSWGHLSEGARDKVYLSLCLALVEARERLHAPLPLVWKDVFTHFDSRQVPETAEMLCKFAREGRQILLLTRHEHVASVFRLMNVPERTLTASQDWRASDNRSDQRRSRFDVNHLLTVAGDADSTDVDLSWEPVEEREVDEEFSLYDHSPIEQAPSLGSENAARLRRLEITTVGDLIEASADNIASNLSYAGVSSSMVADWQSQALLMCHVARLREYNARILVACGIKDPHQLRQIPPIEVRAMIERFAESSEGRAMLLSGTEFELSRVTDWVRTDAVENDRHHRPGGNARTNSPASSRSASSRSASSRSASSRSASSRSASSRSASSRSASSRSASGDRSRFRQSHGQRSGGSSQRTSSQRSDSRTKQRDEQRADVVQMNPTSESSEFRFYLESDAGVVDAPSIGPRSAERLEAVGVVTVSDFLAADADDMAGRLKNKRMSAKLIREWQQQTALACRVPRLRGHDAQILVAVGVTEVEQLASMDPQELWSQVEPFTDSTAGKRIIRSGKAPDFEEVFHWIEWADRPRALKVA